MKALYQDLPFTTNLYINFYVEDLPHFIVPWHYHPAIEIMYIVKGTGTRFVGDNIEKYTEGDVCMIGPKLPHEWRNDNEFFQKESGLRSTCICLFFKKEIFEPHLICLPEMNGIRQLMERSQRGIKFLGESKEKIGQFIAQAAKEEGTSKVSNLISLLDLMASSSEYEILSSVVFAESVSSNDFERFNKIYNYLISNFKTPIKLEDVANLVGLTPTAFCRYFKARTKKTFVEYLNDIRIGHARKLLIEGKMKIATVSEESGFNNFSNFIEQFKKSTNRLPSDFQKEFGAKGKPIL